MHINVPFKLKLIGMHSRASGRWHNCNMLEIGRKEMLGGPLAPRRYKCSMWLLGPTTCMGLIPPSLPFLL